MAVARRRQNPPKRSNSFRQIVNKFAPVRSTIAVLILLWPGLSAQARERAEIEDATRLQIFLDRANFGPGKIDGRYGEFTTKALELYRSSNGNAAPGGASPLPAVAEPPKETNKGSAKPAPDVSGLDLASIDPVFTSYVVTPDDEKMVGELPGDPAAEAKLKWLPYRTIAEAVAERFHCDIDFLEELNPGKTKSLKAGDTVSVPNVEPFYFSREKEGKSTKGDKDGAKKAQTAKLKKASEDPAAARNLTVSTKTNMVEVHEGDKIVAAFPVTVGSDETESPIGKWKVEGVTKLPNFRYDKQMLKHGERSANFHLLPPGPNNPVGIMWIGLNKEGIGLHGTESPDQIGRSASHGCVRLANWDIVKLSLIHI